jgi:hypothetical protein
MGSALALLLIVVVILVVIIFIVVLIVVIIIFHNKLGPVNTLIQSPAICRAPEQVGHAAGETLGNEDAANNPGDVRNVRLSEAVGGLRGHRAKHARVSLHRRR